jgi:hypothetical protein
MVIPGVIVKKSRNKKNSGKPLDFPEFFALVARGGLEPSTPRV